MRSTRYLKMAKALRRNLKISNRRGGVVSGLRIRDFTRLCRLKNNLTSRRAQTVKHHRRDQRKVKKLRHRRGAILALRNNRRGKIVLGRAVKAVRGFRKYTRHRLTNRQFRIVRLMDSNKGAARKQQKAVKYRTLRSRIVKRAGGFLACRRAHLLRPKPGRTGRLSNSTRFVLTRMLNAPFRTKVSKLAARKNNPRSKIRAVELARSKKLLKRISKGRLLEFRNEGANVKYGTKVNLHPRVKVIRALKKVKSKVKKRSGQKPDMYNANAFLQRPSRTYPTALSRIARQLQKRSMKPARLSRRRATTPRVETAFVAVSRYDIHRKLAVFGRRKMKKLNRVVVMRPKYTWLRNQKASKRR